MTDLGISSVFLALKPKHNFYTLIWGSNVEVGLVTEDSCILHFRMSSTVVTVAKQ